MNGKVMGQIAVAFQDGSSDKVWCAAWSDAGEYICMWGRRPVLSQSQVKQLPSAAAARSLFDKKTSEKLGKGYVEVAFDDPRFGARSFDSALSRQAAPTTSAAPLAKPRFHVARVAPAGWEAIESCRSDPDLGVSEKINGVRCVLEADEAGAVTAYNRSGRPMAGAPAAAAALGQLGMPFCIDGEWVAGVDGDEAFVAFEVMSLGTDDLRQTAYKDRIERLRKALRVAGLVSGGGPTMRAAQASSLTPGLMLLIAQSGQDVYEDVIKQVVAEGREGVVVRRLSARYIGEPTDLRKFKLTTDIDVVILAAGQADGAKSLTMGLIRESDGALVEVGKVRSGLIDSHVDAIAAALASGGSPVMKVSYLGARTVGTKLVEARTSYDWLRTDKSANECTTSQMGADKAALFEACVPYGRVVAGNRPRNVRVSGLG